MWRNEMWSGLLRWCEGDAEFRRELVIRRAARQRIREQLSEDRLGGLSSGEFSRSVAARGSVRHPDGSPLAPGELAQLTPERLQTLIDDGRLVVTGNPFLVAANSSCPSGSVVQCALPGLDSGGSDTLRHALGALLHDPAMPPADAIRRATAKGSPLSPELAAVIRSLCSLQSPALCDPTRLLGLRRLSLLTGTPPRGILTGPDAEGSGDAFDVACDELRSASRGVLRDPLALDLLLLRIAALREPGAWKIAIGLNETGAEAEAIARRCLTHGFAAISPDDPSDASIERLQGLVVGDCVVMHLRGRIGAIGRVTRPYYEVDREEGGPLERRWWRRVGVQWLAGDRDYGSLLAGSRQRRSVIELDWETFRAIARMYRREPAYDRLFRPLHGSWLVRCDDERHQTLLRLDKPLPLRDQLSPAPICASATCTPGPGDTIFLCHADSGAIIGAATVLSEPRQTGQAAGRVEVSLERLCESPLDCRALAADPLLGEWQPPGDAVSWVPPEPTAALMHALDLPRMQHFALLAEGRAGTTLRSRERYLLADRNASAPAHELAQAAEEGTARCLIYHAAPENAFVGFGQLLDLHERTPEADPTRHSESRRALEVSLEVYRFSRKPGGWMPEMSGDAQGRAGRAHLRREPLTRTVFPIAADDFCRVVSAGMGERPPDETAGMSLELLAEEAGAPLRSLQEMVRLVRDRGQMILYGPPGTGKTWLALRLALHLCGGDANRRELVQFHPAYSYEDFIEGIRPQVIRDADGGSSVDYPLVRGSFAAFCDRALLDPHGTYVFVIDEINRAQMAAIFGELMLALEYRGREVQLAHARGPAEAGEARGLVVPPNILLLGTMNTADRTTALVDHALRRRFAFYPLFPDDSSLVRPMFQSWLARHAPDAAWVADLLAELNAWLEPEVGRHLLIGHSYFIRPGLDEEMVREIWRFQIVPLLEEYFAGMPERLRALDIDDLIWRAREHEQVLESTPAGEA